MKNMVKIHESDPLVLCEMILAERMTNHQTTKSYYVDKTKLELQLQMVVKQLDADSKLAILETTHMKDLIKEQDNKLKKLSVKLESAK